ncbi:MAG: metallophosphoesterase [Phycisphaerales bacterium]
MSFGAWIHQIVFASAAFDFVVGALALWILTRSNRVITLPRLIAAVCATGVVFVFKLIPLVVVGLNGFGAIHLVWVDLIIVTPALSLGALLVARLSSVRVKKLALLVASLAIVVPPAVGVYAMMIEPYRVVLERPEFRVDPARAGVEAVRIGVLADIQTTTVTDHERDAVARLMAEAPDLILMPGDLFQPSPRRLRAEVGELRDLLSRLHAPAGVFYVVGDCDTAGEMRQILDGLDIELLVNEAVEVTVRDRVLMIGGVDLFYESTPAMRFVDAFARAPGADDIRILLTHRPDVIERIPDDGRVDLVVAGHTHGGQVQVPFFGPPITLTGVPRRVAAGGLHEHAGRPIYLSRGLGWEHGQAPRLRFNCPPEITILTLLADE